MRPRGSFVRGSAGWLVGALACGLAIGFLLRRPPAVDPADPTEGVSTPPPVRSGVTAGRAPRPRGEVRQDSETSGASVVREIESLAARSPAEARAKLEMLAADGELRMSAFEALARGWAVKDPEAAAAWIETLPDEEDQVAAMGGLVPGWSSSDPDACLAWSRELPSGTLREMSLVELSDAWAAADPVAAFGTFSALESEDGIERGLHGITADWVLDDPDSALHHLSALAADQRRDEFLETALVSLTNQDPHRSWREADRVPGRADHIRAMALEAIAETDPQRALSLARTADEMPPEWWTAIARGWSLDDPQAAASWARTVDDPDLRTTVLEEIDRIAD